MLMSFPERAITRDLKTDEKLIQLSSAIDEAEGYVHAHALRRFYSKRNRHRIKFQTA